MRAFQYHPLSKITVKEKLLLRMSFSESAWMILGMFLAMQMADFVPRLPFPLLMGYIHYGIPIFICAVFAFIKHNTGMSFMQYFMKRRKYKKNKKKRTLRSVEG